MFFKTLHSLHRGPPFSSNTTKNMSYVHSGNSNGRVQSWQKLRRNRILPAGLPVDHVFGQRSLHVGLFFIGVCRNLQKDRWASQREFLTDIWRTPPPCPSIPIFCYQDYKILISIGVSIFLLQALATSKSLFLNCNIYILGLSCHVIIYSISVIFSDLLWKSQTHVEEWEMECLIRVLIIS